MRPHSGFFIAAIIVLFALITPAFCDVVSVTPDKLNFGDQVISTFSTRSVSLLNPTKKPLNVLGFTMDGDFSLDEVRCSFPLAPFTRCDLPITFFPSAPGPRTGTFTIRTDAGEGALKVQLSGNGVPVQLVSVDIQPANPTAGMGATVSFSLIGRYNNGNWSDFTSLATWTSSNPNVAPVNASGAAFALSTGNTTISAAYSGLSGSTVLTVTPPVLSFLNSITPPKIPVPKGLTQQFTVTGTFTDGSIRDMTASVQWSSSAPAIATVSPAGLATAVTQGFTFIRAASGNMSTTAELTVTDPVLVSVKVTPATWSMAMHGTKQLTAIATYSDGPSFDATSSATWSSLNTSIATVSSTGLVTAGLSFLGSASIQAFVPISGKNIGTATAAVEFFSPGDTITPRQWHTSVLLRDGRVLILGGLDNFGRLLSSAELFTPASHPFQPVFGSVVGTGSLNFGRQFAAAALLPDGKVLVVGGGPAEVYDPQSGSFAVTGPMNFGRLDCTATLLNTGQVLIAGGGTSHAELYDPTTGTFSLTGDTQFSGYGNTATLLSDGRVLIAGGGVNTAEIYDPLQQRFTAAGDLSVVRSQHTATLLANGKVLIAGGLDGNSRGVASAEIFDPATGAFHVAGSPMAAQRGAHTATLLRDGQVLIAGGLDFTTVLSSVEKFDPVTETFMLAGDMVNNASHDPSGTRAWHTATALLNWQIVFIGGVMNDTHVTFGMLTYQPAPQ